MVEKQFFGVIDGQDVYKYTLSDKIKVSVLTRGATIISIVVPNKQGGFTDVALGINTAEDFAKLPGYMGSVVGRCANRIAFGKFSLNGKDYELCCNNGKAHLHGGKDGFDKKVYEVQSVGENSVTFRGYSLDGEEGYPSRIDYLVTYSVIGKEFSIRYEAVSDGNTIFNPTNHVYFNLNGENDGSVLDNYLCVVADSYLPVDENLIPTGEVRRVKGTPFDFCRIKQIGQDINASDEQLGIAGGYDHNFCLSCSHCATAVSLKTGVMLDVFTDMPGMQVYTGNFLSGEKCKSVYNKQSGFCLETQFYPNAINSDSFVKPILHANERFCSTTKYVFDVFTKDDIWD